MTHSLALAFVACALFAPLATFGATYECAVTHKLESDGSVYSEERLRNGQFSVVVHDGPQPALERCSYTASEGKVTCDKYDVDRIAYDENVDLKKFYVFRSQFDVQLFSSLRFVENNGRGGLAFGTCKVTELERIR